MFLPYGPNPHGGSSMRRRMQIINMIILALLLINSAILFSGCDLIAELFREEGVPLADNEILYITNEGSGDGGSETGTDIIAIGIDGNAAVVGTDFFGPSGIAVHPETGDLYISDDQNDIYMIDDTNTLTEIATGLVFHNPNALAFDNQGRLLIAEAGSEDFSGISRVDLDEDPMTREVLASGFDNPQAVLFYDGAVYFTDNSGSIFMIEDSDDFTGVTPATVAVYAEGVAASTQGGLAVDRKGAFYLSAYADGEVLRVDPHDRHISSVFESDGFHPRGLTLSNDGTTLFVTGCEEDEIRIIDLRTRGTEVFSSDDLLDGPTGLVICTTPFFGFSAPGDD